MDEQFDRWITGWAGADWRDHVSAISKTILKQGFEGGWEACASDHDERLREVEVQNGLPAGWLSRRAAGADVGAGRAKFALIVDGLSSTLQEFDVEPEDDSPSSLMAGRLVAHGTAESVRAVARLRGDAVLILGETWPRCATCGAAESPA